MDERTRRVQRLRFGNAAGPHGRGRQVLDDEPCLCGTGFTCLARVHDDEPDSDPDHAPTMVAE